MNGTNVTKRSGASVTERARAVAATLSPAERRVADVVASDPEAVAFGTVASLAARAGTSGPTVLRLAARLGYAGFVDLQAAVRSGLSQRLRPAVERIRGATPASALTRALDVEVANVRRTLEAVDARGFGAAVDLLADPRRRVFVLPSEQCRPPGTSFAVELGLLRDRVRLVGGSEFRVVSQLARLGRADVVLLVDVQRHERWIVEASRRVAASGARRIVLTDDPLSPLATGAQHVFVVAADAAGPFDSAVGILALLNALVAGVADVLRPAAARRIERLEQTWVESGALLE
jgi:DNA-binding MurR/RpiR family transcriptional regulator